MASQSAAAVLEPYLVARVADLGRLDPLVRKSDPEAVHDIRVAARRLRSMLASYNAVFDPAIAQNLRAELAWLAGALSQSRDLEVQHAIIRDVMGNDDQARVQNVFGTIAAEAAATQAEAMDSARYRRLVEDLRVFAENPRWTPEAQHPSRTLMVEALSLQFSQLGSRAEKAEHTKARAKLDRRLHDVRKATKRTRYATDAAESVLGVEARMLTRQLSTGQDVLGKHHDLVVALRWVGQSVVILDERALHRLKALARQSRHEAQQVLRPLQQIATTGQALGR